MNIVEEKNYYVWLKDRLWKAYFDGRANKRTHRDIEFCNLQLGKIQEIEFPRKKKR